MPKRASEDTIKVKKKKKTEEDSEDIELDTVDEEDVDLEEIQEELPPEVVQALNITAKKKKAPLVDDTDYVPELERDLLEDLAEAEEDL